MREDDQHLGGLGSETAGASGVERAVDAVEAVISRCHQLTALERRREVPDAQRLERLAVVRAEAKRTQRELSTLGAERLAQIAKDYAGLLAELSTG